MKLFTWCLAIVFAAVLLIVWLVPTKGHAECYSPYCMHEASIRPPVQDVQPEPRIKVQRYSADDLKNDDSVLVAIAKPVEAPPAKTVDPEKVKLLEQVDELECENLKYKAKEVTGTVEAE